MTCSSDRLTHRHQAESGIIIGCFWPIIIIVNHHRIVIIQSLFGRIFQDGGLIRCEILRAVARVVGLAKTVTVYGDAS